MSLGSMPVLASTKFVPVANPGPIVTAYMRNMTGTVNALVPANIAAGHYRCTTPDDIDPLRTSVTAAAATAAGLYRHVNVVITPGAGIAPSIINIFVRNDAAALVDDAAFVEVTLERVPSRRNVISSMIFAPANPVVSLFAALNCTGLVGAATDRPVRIGAGQYRFFVPAALIDREVSITKRAANAAGTNRLVTVVLSAPVGTSTQVDVFIATDAGVASDDALFVECTIQRLPL